MLKKLSVLTLLLVAFGFSSCEKEDKKQRPILVTAQLNPANQTLFFEWDGVEGQQHTIIFESSDPNAEVYEIGFDKFYKGYKDISNYTKEWVYEPIQELGKWTLKNDVYSARVIANYDDGENVSSDPLEVTFPFTAE